MPRASLDLDASRLRRLESLMRTLALGEGAEALGSIVCEHLDTGGKRLRARLALAAADALDVDPGASLPWGAACELLHNGTLIHDDIQDGDRARRGAPTAWVRHGLEQALNAGDLLFVLPFAALEQITADDEVRFGLCRALSRHGAAVIRGQAAELELRALDHVTVEAYLEASRGKTSALFELPVEGAAVLARLPPTQAAVVRRPFRTLGVLFQLQDDVLDLYGEKGRDERGADLREGKVSALVVEHLALQPQDRGWVFELLRTPRDQTDAAQVQRAIDAFRKGGALAAVADRMRRLRDALVAQGALPGRLGALLSEVTEVVLNPVREVLDGV